MANKLITLEELVLYGEEHKEAGDSVNFYNFRNEDNNYGFYKLFSLTYTNIWANDRFVFSYTSRHSGSGFIILSMDFSGDLNSISGCEVRVIRSEYSLWAPNEIYFLYNTSTHELSCWQGNSDYNTANLRLLSKRSSSEIVYNTNPVRFGEYPEDAGVAIPVHKALFDDTFEKASTSEIQSIFGGGLISRLFTKLTEVVRYA